MNFFKKLLGKNTAPPGNEGFWTWFQEYEKTFYQIVRDRDAVQINDRFLQKIMPKLQAMQNTFYCETGMYSDNMAELIISAQGDVKSFVFAEELVAVAPTLDNWKFTALKPATGVKNMRIKMDGYTFDDGLISFFYDDDPRYPDDINITFVHLDYNTENKDIITHGVFLYLESMLGERDAATLIDQGTVLGVAPPDRETIPMEKLGDFLVWKEKEFVEKYHDTRRDTENDAHAIIEGTDEDGFANIATLDTDLLEWDSKASHPWMMVIEIDYEKTNGVGNNGMPNEQHYKTMLRLEEELAQRLPDAAGYLILVRQTYKGKRTVYLACKEFRIASKTTQELLDAYKSELTSSYEIYKDKYWKTMEPFRTGD